MSMNELPQMRRADTRGSVCVVIAVREDEEHLQQCLESVRLHTRESVLVVRVPPSAAEVNHALEQLAPADVLLLSEPCHVSAGWLQRLRDAARGETNTATASALADTDTALALSEEGRPEDFGKLTDSLAEHTLRLRPRMRRAVGPCVYIRRDALELVGPLDEELSLRSALEIDFAQRCVLSGLTHVAADDVVIERLVPAPPMAAKEPPESSADELPAQLLERYPYLSESSAVADSSVLQHALQVARGSSPRLWVTIDARALDGAVTGTQVHILELILALAGTRSLRLRLLVRTERIDRETLGLLRGLPATEILAAEDIDPATPKSTVFHRPQQTFSHDDVALALRLGERLVLSQLDLIAYRNPGYFADAGSWEDYRRASRHGLSAADRVVVFSDHTRRELVSDALVEEVRIRVVPPGLDHRISGEPRRPAALDDDAGVRMTNDFLLCLGTDFRHKNRIFALRLLASLREDHEWQGSLVLAGTHIPNGSSRELERAFLQEHGELREAVMQLGSVSEEEKGWLIAHAGAVVYPSVYEGFGLVPFESALCGVPCLFASQSSLAEAAPHETATILPWSSSESAAAAHALLTDPDARARHVESLAAAAGDLTWAAAATAMVDVYREASVAPVRDAATLSRDAVERERTLSATHDAVAQMLIGERELVLRDYHELVDELGPGRGLIGPSGALPENVQRALLGLSARPALSRPLFGALTCAFLAARAFNRAVHGQLRRPR